MVYNQQFESARLDELAAALPDFAERIKNIQARLWDLLPVVRNHVYQPAFAGSYSLKSVLPSCVNIVKLAHALAAFQIDRLHSIVKSSTTCVESSVRFSDQTNRALGRSLLGSISAAQLPPDLLSPRDQPSPAFPTFKWLSQISLDQIPTVRLLLWHVKPVASRTLIGASKR